MGTEITKTPKAQQRPQLSPEEATTAVASRKIQHTPERRARRMDRVSHRNNFLRQFSVCLLPGYLNLVHLDRVSDRDCDHDLF